MIGQAAEAVAKRDHAAAPIVRECRSMIGQAAEAVAKRDHAAAPIVREVTA